MNKEAQDLIAAWGETIVAKSTSPVQEKKDKNKIIVEGPTHRSLAEQQLLEMQRRPSSGGHKSRPREEARGGKPKHRKDLRDAD